MAIRTITFDSASHGDYISGVTFISPHTITACPLSTLVISATSDVWSGKSCVLTYSANQSWSGTNKCWIPLSGFVYNTNTNEAWIGAYFNFSGSGGVAFQAANTNTGFTNTAATAYTYYSENCLGLLHKSTAYKRRAASLYLTSGGTLAAYAFHDPTVSGSLTSSTDIRTSGWTWLEMYVSGSPSTSGTLKVWCGATLIINRDYTNIVGPSNLATYSIDSTFGDICGIWARPDKYATVNFGKYSTHDTKYQHIPTGGTLSAGTYNTLFVDRIKYGDNFNRPTNVDISGFTFIGPTGYTSWGFSGYGPIINSQASITSSLTVSLKFSATTNLSGESGIWKYQKQNVDENNQPIGSWSLGVNYSGASAHTSVSHNLASGGPGNRYVYVRFVDIKGRLSGLYRAGIRYRPIFSQTDLLNQIGGVRNIPGGGAGTGTGTGTGTGRGGKVVGKFGPGSMTIPMGIKGKFVR